MEKKNPTRRSVIKALALTTAMAGNVNLWAAGTAQKKKEAMKLKGNINHSVCQWTFGKMPLDELCLNAKN